MSLKGIFEMSIKLSVLSLFFMSTLFGNSAITYDFSGGRFGDNLLTYLHAKWCAYQYRLPFLYKPFNYSSELNMDVEEKRYSENFYFYRNEIVLNRQKYTPHGENTIFVCPYFPEIKWELKRENYFTFPVDWKNKEFRSHVRHMISPRNFLELIYPPENMLSIAIHMREGGGYDDEEHKFKHPLKTPPVSFYSESLKKILQMFPGQPMFCHIFTDALDPQGWINKMLADLPENVPIQFCYRKHGNRHDSNVLEDFFSFFNFDVLIRAESNYSIVPSLIHDYALVCYPMEYSIKGRVVTIDQIKVEINQERLDECSKKYLAAPEAS